MCPTGNSAESVCGKPVAQVINGRGQQRVIPWCRWTLYRLHQLGALLQVTPDSLRTTLTPEGTTQITAICQSINCWFPDDALFHNNIPARVEAKMLAVLRGLQNRHHVVLYKLPFGGRSQVYWPLSTRAWVKPGWAFDLGPKVDAGLRMVLKQVQGGQVEVPAVVREAAADVQYIPWLGDSVDGDLIDFDHDAYDDHVSDDDSYPRDDGYMDIDSDGGSNGGQGGPGHPPLPLPVDLQPPPFFGFPPQPPPYPGSPASYSSRTQTQTQTAGFVSPQSLGNPHGANNSPMWYADQGPALVPDYHVHSVSNRHQPPPPPPPPPNFFSCSTSPAGLGLAAAAYQQQRYPTEQDLPLLASLQQYRSKYVGTPQAQRAFEQRVIQPLFGDSYPVIPFPSTTPPPPPVVTHATTAMSSYQSPPLPSPLGPFSHSGHQVYHPHHHKAFSTERGVAGQPRPPGQGISKTAGRRQKERARRQYSAQ